MANRCSRNAISDEDIRSVDFDSIWLKKMFKFNTFPTFHVGFYCSVES